ncbi:MAG: bifunctional 5,10-methylenetetrahydrofolate dehydrogenase/5,10-methenyltetrahydrofolate cyclohydrolase [Clostridia bacterium]
MGVTIDVARIVENKKEELKKRIKKLKDKNIVPKLAVILANNDESSRIYISKKRKMCEEVGIDEVESMLDDSCDTNKVLDIIKRLNMDDTVDAILVQLPIFPHLDEKKILYAIDCNKDVDGFHPLNLGKMLIGDPSIISCTPKGIALILDSVIDSCTGLNAVVVGRSIIVGKPMAQLLLNRDATVTICHRKTKNLKSFTKNADILVVATGCPHLITKDMVKNGCIVIDVGINRVDNKIIGDVDTQEVINKAKYITSVPGGVGRTTIVSLIDNIVTIAENR